MCSIAIVRQELENKLTNRKLQIQDDIYKMNIWSTYVPWYEWWSTWENNQ